MLKNIKEFVKEWKAKMADDVSALTRQPQLAIFQVGDVEASNRYVRNKIKDCEEVGIRAILFKMPEDTTTIELIINIAHAQKQVDGVIVQLPLPDHIDLSAIKDVIDDKCDVDGFKETSPFNPCTPLGIIKYLEYCDYDLTGKNVTIVGRSDIVGKPLARMMTNKNATVTLCHSKTKNIETFYAVADLIILAVGKLNFFNCQKIKVKAPIIDVGINFNEEGKLCGDACNKEYGEVTPVPGGVGLLTRCGLLDNVIAAARLKEE